METNSTLANLSIRQNMENYVLRMFIMFSATNVKSALALVVRLFLEHSKVTESSSMVQDSAMLIIKETTNADVFHSNSFGKVNANFAHFVIDFLSMLLLFDAYSDHNANASPAPWADRNFSMSE
jgi:hypothetical protein